MMLDASALPGNRLRPLDYASLAYLLVFLVFWTAIALLLRQEPPIDNIEQLNWALHPALGYSKHPFLPTLILWVFEQIAPAGIVLTYVLGALQVLFTMSVAYWIGTTTLGAQRGWLGALLISCISYYTLRMHFYNHNTALLCATAAAMLCTWQAAHGRDWKWWAALGLCWAAGMLSKYQMAVSIACNLAFLVWSLRREPQRLLRGVTLAGLMATLLLTPHIVWLVQNHFPTFTYAANSLGAALPAAARWDSLLRFLASQFLRVLPAVLLMGLMHRLARRHGQSTQTAVKDQPQAALFWSIHALGPLALMSVMAIVAGVDLEMHWGTAFLWALPMWHLSTRRGQRLAGLPRNQLLLLLTAMQVLLMTGKTLFPDL